jgi:hypothetical protein
MKTSNRTIRNLVVIASLAIPSWVNAQVLTLTPTQAVDLPGDGSGVTKVALLFDLSGIPQGQGRRIDNALLDWRMSGVPSSRRSEYAAYIPAGPWTIASVVVPTLSEPTARWRIEPFDYQRNQGGFVRLNLTSLVRDWTGGARQNLGVVVATPDVSGTALVGQLGGAVLTIRYGFIR